MVISCVWVIKMVLEWLRCEVSDCGGLWWAVGGYGGVWVTMVGCG